MVLKPSEQTPLTTLKLAELIAELFPPGVVNIVTGRGETRGRAADQPAAGARWSRSPAMSAPAQKVLQAAAQSVKRTHLELGGKAPVIVFDDADIESGGRGRPDLRLLQRRPGLHGRLPHLRRREDVRQAGGRPERAVASIKVGTQQRGRRGDGAADLRRAAPARGRLRRARRGSRSTSRSPPAARRGGGKGFFFEPTVVAGARQDDEIVRREVFGPVVSVTRFEDADAGGRLGQRLATTGWPLGVDAGHRQGHEGGGRGCSTAAPGSTRISCW